MYMHMTIVHVDIRKSFKRGENVGKAELEVRNRDTISVVNCIN